MDELLYKALYPEHPFNDLYAKKCASHKLAHYTQCQTLIWILYMLVQTSLAGVFAFMTNFESYTHQYRYKCCIEGKGDASMIKILLFERLHIKLFAFF